MQVTRSCMLAMAPPQDAAPGGATSGQVGGKPGVRSDTPSHVLSGPPQALQMAAIILVSAPTMAATALPSPGRGQGLVALPLVTAPQHLASAFDLATRKPVAALPIVT